LLQSLKAFIRPFFLSEEHMFDTFTKDRLDGTQQDSLLSCRQ
jgi:hypothetical protein